MAFTKRLNQMPGFLERIRSRINGDGTCETCGNLTRIGDSLIACEAHDKLIMPEYLPYHGKMKCPDFSVKTTEREK